MSSKQPSKSEKTSSASKTKASSSKAAQKTPQPQSVQRFWGEAICVIGFPRATEEALGPKLLQEVLAEMNKIGINFVFQDDRHVVNLTTGILAIKT